MDEGASVVGESEQVALVRGRALVARACGYDVHLPIAGVQIEQWTRALMMRPRTGSDARELPLGIFETIDGMVTDRLAPVVEPIATMSAADARELVPVHIETGASRRQTGTFYTARDACDYIVAITLVPLIADRMGWVGGDECVTAGHDVRAWAQTQLQQLDASGRRRLRGVLADLRIVDPSCGSGAFLVAACDLLTELARGIGMSRSDAVSLVLATLHGLDLSPAAVEAARCVLMLHACDAGMDPTLAAAIAIPRIGVADATLPLTDTWDAVIGNPPFVNESPESIDDGRRATSLTASTRNRSAWIAERALDALQPGGRIGLVLPLSTICTTAFEPARAHWRESCDRLWVRSYDCIPSTLFPGVVQRIALMVGRATTDMSLTHDTYTSSIARWRSVDRASLFDNQSHVAAPSHSLGGSIAKIGSEVEVRVLDKLGRHAPAGELILRGRAATASTNRFWYKRRWSYFLLLLDHVPTMRDAAGSERMPSEFKPVAVVPQLDAHVLLAVYSSSLFWWFFSVFGDNRNLNRRELEGFPFSMPDPDLARHLADAAARLMVELRASSTQRECTYQRIGTITNTYYSHGSARPILDTIDTLLADHYGLKADELEFILGYEARFRAGSVQLSADDVHDDRLTRQQ